MAIRAERVTVTDVPTPLWTQSRGGALAALVRNAGSVSVDLGDEDVATGAGFELPAGAAVSVDLSPDEGLWAVTASGTVRVDMIQSGVQS